MPFNTYGYRPIGNAYPEMESPLATFQKGKNPVVPVVTPKANGAPIPLGNDVPGFDINPAPQTGQGAYGKVPGPIAYPTTPWEEATKISPDLTGILGGVANEIKSQVAGEFTPEEENALWDVANRFGVASGMPGAQLWSNKFMGNRIEEGAKRRQMGVQNFQSLVSELSKLGMDPALAAQIAAHNAQLAAAPDPKAAADELFRKYLEALGLGRNQGLGGVPNLGGGGFSGPQMGTLPAGVSLGPSAKGFNFNTASNIPPTGVPTSMPKATTSYDLYGLGNTPAGTAYDPFTDSSINAPWLQDWSNLWGGLGSTSPSAGTVTPAATGGLYGYGETPANTSYNPYSDQSTYDPFAELGYGWYDTGPTDADWDEMFFNLGY